MTSSNPSPSSVQRRSAQQVCYHNDYLAALGDFYLRRDALKRTAVDGRNDRNNRTFILADKLFDAENCNLFNRLWASAYMCMYSDPPDPTITEILDDSRRIFCILLDLGYPLFITDFRQRGLTDSALPVQQNTLIQTLHHSLHFPNNDDINNFSYRFYNQQFAWCPIVFDLDMGTVYEKGQIIPFYRKVQIIPYRDDRVTAVNNATLWEIDVPEELVGPKLRDRLPHALVTKTKDDEKSRRDGGKGNFYRFALKEFVAQKQYAFIRERRVIKALRNEAGMVQYIGWYESSSQWPRNSPPPTYNLVLELADYDLYTAIRKIAPPISSVEIQASWAGMLELADALKSIHKLMIDGIPYDVWHGDIKPENILRVQDSFKLSDPGEARIQRSETGNDKPRAPSTGGTCTYAGPEVAGFFSGAGRRPSVLQNSDVWSLGCVFSVVATYFVLGAQGVLLYELVRREAFRTAKKTQGDAFHDGTSVLRAVTHWHDYLRAHCRRSDNLTPDVLKMVDQHMLVADGDRYTAEDVCHNLEKLIQERDMSSEVPEDIEAILQNIDVGAERNYEQSLGISRGESEDARTITLDEADSDSIKFKSLHELHQQGILPTANRSLIRGRPPSRHFKGGSERPIPSTSSFTERADYSQSTAQAETKDAGATSAFSGEVSSLSADRLSPDSVEMATEEMPYTIWNAWDDLEFVNKGKSLQKSSSVKSSIGGSLRSAFRKSPRQVSAKGSLSLDTLEKFFEGRDIIFLVDNGSSMTRYWRQVTQVVQILVWRALGYDDDGIELYFSNPQTNTFVTQSKQQSVKDFVYAMDRARPEPEESQSGHRSRIDHFLYEKMAKYVSAKAARTKEKPKTIIILTDGAWKGMQEDDGVDKVIKGAMDVIGDSLRQYPGRAATREEKRRGLEELRPVTIQFIRFGFDRIGCERLRRLDDDLSKAPYFLPDLIDTEPWDGDVYKMFLGSLSKEMDAKSNYANYNNLSQITTPSRMSVNSDSIEERRSRTSSYMSDQSATSRSPHLGIHEWPSAAWSPPGEPVEIGRESFSSRSDSGPRTFEQPQPQQAGPSNWDSLHRSSGQSGYSGSGWSLSQDIGRLSFSNGSGSGTEVTTVATAQPILDGRAHVEFGAGPPWHPQSPGWTETGTDLPTEHQFGYYGWNHNVGSNQDQRRG